MWSWILDLFSWEMPREPEYFSRERMTKTPAQILEEHENFILELQEEKEKQEKYEIVLWWGLDGLKLKDDGTTEWISRRKPEPEYTAQPARATRRFITIPPNVFEQVENATGTIYGTNMQAMQARLDALKVENALQLMAQMDSIAFENAILTGRINRRIAEL